MWFVYATRVRSSGKPPPTAVHAWPIAEMVTATAAFTIWAGALPGSPLQHAPGYTAPLAGVVVLAGTAVLGWVAALLQRPIRTGSPDAAVPRPGVTAAD